MYISDGMPTIGGAIKKVRGFEATLLVYCHENRIPLLVPSSIEQYCSVFACTFPKLKKYSSPPNFFNYLL